MTRISVARLFALIGLVALAACGTHLDQPRSYLVYFDTDSAALTPAGQRIVGTIATSVHDLGPSKVIVAGRADGSTPHDAALADERATAVMQALAQQGVTAAKIAKEADAPPSGRSGVAAHQVVVTLLP